MKVGVRTVDEEAKGDGVNDGHHGHGGLALALGAFGTGVMDELLFRASEEGTHGGTVEAHLEHVRREVDSAGTTRGVI